MIQLAVYGPYRPRDAIQGGKPTCGPVATMRALAGTGFDFGPLIEKVRENVYAVHLWHPWKGIPWTGSVVWKGVRPGDLPLPESGRTWALILHRSLLKMRPSVANTGLDLSLSLYLFTGKYVVPVLPEGKRDAIREAITSGLAVTASTRSEVTPGLGLEEDHAYWVVSPKVLLDSPWGATATVTWPQFVRNFSDVVISPSPLVA